MAVTAMVAFHVGLSEAGGASQDIVLPRAELDRARTICFAILAVGPLLHAFNCRSKTKSIFTGLFENRALWGAAAIGLMLEAATIWLPPLRPIFRTVPLDGEALAWVAAMSLAPVAIGELFKVLFSRR
jgi:Ca2+-transporting ATPase